MNRSYIAGLLGVVGVAASPALAFAQGTLDGRWLSQDKRAVVEVAPCGKAECGKIVWVKDPIDPASGKPRRDKNNSDLGLQHRPIIGLATLSAIVPNADGNWDAHSYDPRNGEDHDITVRLLAGGTRIELKGCALGGMICRSEVWSKAPDATPADPPPPDPTLQTSN